MWEWRERGNSRASHYLSPPADWRQRAASYWVGRRNQNRDRDDSHLGPNPKGGKARCEADERAVIFKMPSAGWDIIARGGQLLVRSGTTGGVHPKN